MAKFRPTGKVTAAMALAAATVGVYATEWLAFMWPVMAMIDVAAAMAWRRRRSR